MNILMLSTDRNLLNAESTVRSRIIEQAGLVNLLKVIIFAPKGKGLPSETVGHRLEIFATLSFHRALYVVDALRIGRRLIGAKGTDWLVTAQDPFWTGVVAWLVARTTGAALHIQLHTDPFSLAWRSEHVSRRFLFPLAMFLLRQADGVRVISARLETSVRGLGVPADKITRVPIPIDVALFRDAPVAVDLHRSYTEYSQIVLSMGRLTHEKNFSLLLRAFARVRRVHEGALLVLVGHGPLLDDLRFLARSLDIEAHVRFLPWARDVASYYKSADVYVQPSLYEGWGLAVIEAMASGTPVVMTDVGCAGEVLRDRESGLVVDVGDEGSLSEALSWILAHPDEAKRLALRGMAATEHLATKKESLELYKTSWNTTYAHRQKERRGKRKKGNTT
jgi:glycosyltransferase involved in cell wall biosynthesis